MSNPARASILTALDAFAAFNHRTCRIYDKAGAGLAVLGHRVVRLADWDNTFGAVGAVIHPSGDLLGGSDPREETWAAGEYIYVGTGYWLPVNADDLTCIYGWNQYNCL